MLYLHEDRFNELVKRDNTAEDDLERRSLFYILSGNLDLYNKVDYIYDFDERKIKSECLESEEIDFCSSSRKLIKLGYNLYNSSNSADVIDTFYILDDDNFELALNAIKLRFDKLKLNLVS